MPFPVNYVDGKVGIGTNDPQEALDVEGNLNVSGTITQAGVPVGGVTLAAVGSTPNANGASYADGVLNLQPASATHPGVVTAGAQTFGGAKTFAAQITAGAGDGTVAATMAGRVEAQFFTNNSGSLAPQIRNYAANGDAGSSTGIVLNTESPYSNAGTKIVGFYNDDVIKAFVDKDGNLEFSGLASVSSVIIKSPDGTRYRITVANGGALSTTAA